MVHSVTSLWMLIFGSLEQVQDMAWVWMCHYNEHRTQKRLGNIPMAEYQ